MRSNLILLVLFLQSLFTFSQIEEPVTWTYNKKAVGPNEYELLFKATIEDGWHLYSQHLPSEDGPIATSFTFKKSENYELIGPVQEPKAISEYDPNFMMDLNYFEHEVTFKQRVKVLKEGEITVTGEQEFMVCDATKCLPPEYPSFSFKLTGTKTNESIQTEASKTVSASKQKSTAVSEISTPSNDNPAVQEEVPTIYDPVSWTFDSKKLSENEYELTFTATIEGKWHLYSQKLPSDDGPVATLFTFEESAYKLLGETTEGEGLITKYDENFDMELSYFEKTATFKQKVKVDGPETTVKGEITFMTCDDEKCLPPEYVPFEFKLKGTGKSAVGESPSDDKKKMKRSLIAIFFLSFLSGFAALLTPCVFPMIPMTVSFFTKQSKDRAKGIKNAIFYGISIIVIYVILGTAVTAIFGSDALNALSTNVYFNLFFFVLLVVFAVSFLGAFEITLPSSWVNKADQASDKGGLIGIFFMAFTLALVSFSCTGPIVGTLLVEAATIGGSGPVIGMLGFSTALALPFGLFAAFPGWMNSLPQSGGWLNTVKVFLGFLELALAFKFLSNADLVVQAHLLEREMFLAIWIGIFFALALYLFGFIQLPHDSPIERISVGRALLGSVTLIFVVYLIPGLWGAPLKLISGFPPPMSYSESPYGFGGTNANSYQGSNGQHGPEGTHLGPQGLPVFHDMDEGIAYAKKVNKPVFLDFTGHACVNCRKMEENVWGEPGVIEILRENVVVVSLYVDDKRELPVSEQKEVQIGSKTKQLKTIGNLWSYVQATRYKTNTQPYYRMLNTSGEDLGNGSADYEHHGNVEDFKRWLEEGLKEFNTNS